MEGGGADLPADGRAPPRRTQRPDRRRSLEQGYAAAVAELLDLRRELASVHASRSWRLTAPLRWLRNGHPAAAPLPPPAPPPPAAPCAADPAATIPVQVSLLAPFGGDASLLAAPAGLGFALLPAPADTRGHAAVICNAAAERAATEWLAIWDGRSRPLPGWLAMLADSFGTFPNLGMAGAISLDPAGRIVASGASLGPDGSVRPLGAGALPGDAAHGFAACVDTVPVGAVLLPTAVWRRFGGLDPAIESLDHAIAELALRLRAAGLRVVRQPLARLVRPAPAADDPWIAAFGRWQVRNRQIAELGALSVLGLPRMAPPRVLFVDHFVPTPDRDSGSADLHAMLRQFVALGWEPTLLPASDLDRADAYVDDLRRRGVRVATGGTWRDVTAFLAADRAAFELIVVSRASMASGALFAQLRRHSPFAPLVFNTVDLHFLRQERAALLERSAAALDEAFRVQQLELGAIASADCTILLSEAERALVAALLPHARTRVIPAMREIPGRRAPFGPRRGVAFIGGFRHRPNVDAVVSFVREVWPLLATRLGAKLSIVGADAPPEVLALAGPDVELLGHVPDLDAVLARCRVTVAPLRFGAGIKGKVVTSLSAGVPCVASPIAAEGMGLTDGVNVRVAADPAAFAAAVEQLHEQPELWQRLSDAGLAFVRRAYSLEAGRPCLAALLRELDLPVPAEDGPT
ncbi:MAG: glycosyltransferase [Rhodospirillales bacterium]|nr:glycosyltransferase [Rhodospirillales bacterium]